MAEFEEYNAAYTELSEALVNCSAYEMAVEALKTNPTIAALIQERYKAPLPALDSLLQLPEDSLGYIYAASLTQAGLKPLDLEPTLFSWERVNSDASYIEYRSQTTHDIWHVVTGFDTSETGEIGLQAFYVGQFSLPSAIAAVANGLVFTMLLQPQGLPQVLQAIEQGWQMGKMANQLIAQKWEEGWDKPVSQWQSELELQPFKLVA